MNECTYFILNLRNSLGHSIHVQIMLLNDTKISSRELSILKIQSYGKQLSYTFPEKSTSSLLEMLIEIN